MLRVSRIIQRIFLIAVCLLAAQVQAAETIGRVLMTTGEVIATAGSGEKRSLKRRSVLFEGDTIRTGDKAQVQMRFKDGSILSLRANSAFLLETFDYHGEQHADNRVLMRLLEGGFRTITGVIGHDDPKAYRVETPVATIGIRGTNYEAVQESSNALVTAVWQGGIRVSNDQGSLDLGMGADYNFARVIVGETPKGLLEAPAVLQAPLAQPQEKAAVEEDNSRDGDGQSDEDASEAESAELKPEKESRSSDESVVEETPQQQQLPGESYTSEGETLASVESTQDTLALASESETEVDVTTEVDNYSLNTEAGVAPSNEGTGDLSDTTSTTQQPIASSPGDSTGTVTDLRLTDAELQSLDRVGMLIGCRPSATDCTNRMQGGKASDGSSGDPIITSNNDGPGEANFMKVPSQEVYRRGSAQVTHLKTITRYSTPISWGIWNGSQAEPIIVQKDADNPDAKDLVTDTMIFSTAVPTTPEKLVGKHSYNQVVDQLVVAPVAGTTVHSSRFNVDFSTGVVSNGELKLQWAAAGTAEQLLTTFTGNIIRLDGKGGFIDAKFQDINGAAPLATGNNSIGGVFTGADGEAAVMGFSFVEPRSNEQYDGVYILGR